MSAYTSREDIAMPTDATRLHTLEEDQRQEFDDAYVAFELRSAFIEAKERLGEEEAKAIIEQELQHGRTH